MLEFGLEFLVAGEGMLGSGFEEAGVVEGGRGAAGIGLGRGNLN